MALIIVLQNVSNLADISDYEYKVIIGDGSAARSHEIASGRVEGHTRSDGWDRLLELLLQQRRDSLTDKADVL